MIAGYQIESAVGRGGMGVVYRAIQLTLDRPVALKLIAPELADDAEFRERFRREWRIAARLEHPHVVPVYEAGEADGQLYIAMRFIDGTDLRSILADSGRLDLQRAVAIVRQVGSALDAAHSRGLVHRDVKPGNVLIAEEDGADHAYLTDFGLARQVGSSADLTKPGMWVGTVDYIAPEQVRGGAVDARADIYALACVLFHLLTGTVPYPREGDVPKLWAHVNDPPPDVSELRDDLPPTVSDVIKRGMAKDPAARYPSAGDLGRAAQAGLEARDPSSSERSVATGAAAPTRLASATPISAAATRVLRPRTGRRWVAGGAIATLAAVAVVVLISDGDLVSYRAGGEVLDLDVGQGKLVFVRRVGDRRLVSWLDIDGAADGGPTDVPLGSTTSPTSPDVGTDERRDAVLVYSACAQEDRGCDIYRYRFSGQPLRATVSTDRCEESRPSIANNAIAFVRGGVTCDFRRGLQFQPAGAPAPEPVDSTALGADLSDGKLAWLTQTQQLKTATVPQARVTAALRFRNGDEFATPIVLDGPFVYFVDNAAAGGFFVGRVRVPSKRPPLLRRYDPTGGSDGAESKMSFSVSRGRLFFEDGSRIVRDDHPTFKPVPHALGFAGPR